MTSLSPDKREDGTARERIHSAGPWITDKEIAYATEAIKNGWYDDYRLWITRFEEAFAEHLGIGYALATSSGTGALHLALAICDIGPGDEVIVPDTSWVATANVVAYLGATPVFVDVRLDDWNIDPAAVEAAITPQTKAIFPVHLYGLPCEMDALQDIADAHDLLIIEDACPAVGCSFSDRPMGTFGKTSGFSFQGAKMMATGQGGMLVTDDEACYRRAVSLIEHGRDPEQGMFYSAEIGYQYKMPNVVAAMGLAQLERVDELVARKRQLYAWYAERLTGIDGMVMQSEGAKCFSNLSYPSVRIDPARCARNAVADHLSASRIDTRPAFPRMSMFPAFADADTPNAALIESTGLNLPTAAYLTEADVDFICNKIEEAVGA